MAIIEGGLAAALVSPSEQDAGDAREQVALLGFQSIVHPDGDDAQVILRTSVGRIELLASLTQVAAVHQEIEVAALLMQHRQAMKNDHGISAFDQLLRSAVSPTETFCIIEPESGDRLFVMHFADRLPIVVRMSPEQVMAGLDDLAMVSRQTAN